MHASSFQALMAASLLIQVFGAPMQGNTTVCLLPLDEGPCKALIPHYYYDRYTQTCQEFFYGGCDGNANNFVSMEDCEKFCWKIKKVPKACRMVPDEGPCRGYIKRYAYNMKTMRCEQFIYGGCYGNDNNFQDKDSCINFCAPRRDAPSFCYSPKDEGSCSASVTRYYFNIESKACEEFVYTGCGGNSNNFIKVEDCDSVCKKGTKRPRNQNPKIPRIRRPRIQS
ncbi:tissue factor pathway inhibitor 2 [Xenopus laevis]|uniref:Tissue factor pathway inhibitor n=2 Tax=Xenopus laevis TaxID=8355 RepID=A0A1L8FVT1_XENLA|nr:tissue factor pathway inhibitor 2 [Xenopus laevis]OCT75684.1 hypothetical protein XELAEV_18030868mg [Xenopus laevis]